MFFFLCFCKANFSVCLSCEVAPLISFSMLYTPINKHLFLINHIYLPTCYISWKQTLSLIDLCISFLLSENGKQEMLKNVSQYEY